MGKYEKRKKKKFPKVLLVLVLLLFVAGFAIFAMPYLLHMVRYNLLEENVAESITSQVQEIETQEVVGDESATLETYSSVAFPIDLDDGNVQIESLFQFSGVNPDAQKQDVTDVAAIVVINTSNQYLKEATVTATLANGNEVDFLVTNVPAGADAMAFSLENEALLETDVCTDIAVDAIFEEESNFSGVEVTVDGMMITVTNASSEDVENLDVYYHDIFAERYFGGKTYIYNIEYLSAGESMTIAADETLLGIIEVVRVAVNNMN